MVTHFSKWGMAAVAVVLAGCAGGSAPFAPAPLMQAQSITPFGARTWPDKRAKSILFIADESGSAIRLYNPNIPNPTPEETITNGIASPQGLAVDKSGKLFVVNAGAHPDIAVFRRGKTAPYLKITTPAYYGIAVDAKDNIYVTSSRGTVAVYKAGAKKPTKVITGFDDPAGIAIDSKGNIWVADNRANTVSMIPAGTTKIENQLLKNLESPTGLAFGHADTLYVGSLAKVLVYDSGSKKPSATIKKGITNATLNGLSRNGSFFQSNANGNVAGYKKGATKPFTTILGNTNPLGIASWPLDKK